MIADILTFKGFRGWSCGETYESLRWDDAEAGRAHPSQAEIAAWEVERIAAKAAEADVRAAYATAKAEANADIVVQYLRNHTVAECVQYVDTNVTDLASAKAFLKKVAAVMCVLSKEL